MLISYLAVFFTLLHIAWLDLCSDVCNIQDPPELILKLAGSNCATDNGALVQYWLYRYTENCSTQITSPSDVDNTKPLKILLHGFDESQNVSIIRAVKNAYIEKDPNRYNVIVVDYGMYVKSKTLLSYATAYCNVPVVAISVAKFICDQYIENGVDPKNIHVVGNSLGAQVAGVAGRLVSKNCNITVGRITGLDPASLGFMCKFCNANRLDQTSAAFVDVIHTNTRVYGTPLDSGDVDFYVNTGIDQPGCPNPPFNIIDFIKNPDIILTQDRCSHERSCYLFAESILLNSFRSCLDIVCIFPRNVYMGEYCRSAPPLSTYYVNTRASSPFGLGPSGLMN